MSRQKHRWVLIAAMALLGLLPSGCIVTDWRWIWEDDDDYHCQKVQVNMQPDGGPGYAMSVSVPAGR